MDEIEVNAQRIETVDGLLLVLGDKIPRFDLNFVTSVTPIIFMCPIVDDEVAFPSGVIELDDLELAASIRMED